MTLHTPLKAALHRTPAGECRLIVAADETALLDPDDAHEAAREWALEEFADWQRGDCERREFEDFGAWLARMSQPHIRDHEKFALAMTYAERGLLSGPELVAHSRDQRRFARARRAEAA